MSFRSLVCAALAIGVGREAMAQTRFGTAVITVSVPSSVDSARVDASYVVASSGSPLELRVLTRPCVTIENVHVERDGVALGLTGEPKGPWIIWRDATVSNDTIRLRVRYDVKRGRTGVVPLLHPASSLANVHVRVRFDDRAKRVSFPQMTYQGPAEWSGRFVAVPSFVQVGGSLGSACELEVGRRGGNGGLVWRFFLLVGIMAAWVPLYLAWARSSSEADIA